MLRWLVSYTRWLHTQWPAGQTEKLPAVADDHTTNVPGLYVVGDLSGVPLLKLSANAGTRVVQKIASEPAFQNRATRDRAARDDVLDVAIVGGGTSGFAAALEAERQGLRYCVFEASEPFATVVNFPKAKPIYTYPTDMPVEGELRFHDKSAVKEGLLEDLREQTVERGVQWALGRVDHVERRGGALELVVPDGVDAAAGNIDADVRSMLVGNTRIKALRVVVAMGRSGNYRKLNVPGEDAGEASGKVYNRLHDPSDFRGQRVLVVGGGDSALETAIALAECGAQVTLSYRREQFSRAKPENVEAVERLANALNGPFAIEAPTDARMNVAVSGYMADRAVMGSLELRMGTQVRAIHDAEIELETAAGERETIANDSVFTMIGRDAPLDFFRRSGVRVRGEWSLPSALAFAAFLLFCVWLFHWKSPSLPILGIEGWSLPAWLNWAPASIWQWVQSVGGGIGAYFQQEGTFGHTLAISASSRSFYYTLAYSLVIVIFGIRRIRRRKTPYVTVQTWTLMVIQVLPLFVLPELLLPWMGHNGWFEGGAGKWLADTFFPAREYTAHGREYWRAYGFILAWPLLVWNWFTAEPLWGWLILGFAQTFVIIPAMIYRWGKGAYCGWICSCGALAETLGDAHRHKMPHGPVWNRVNMVGQVLLVLAVVIMLLRIIGWVLPDGNAIDSAYAALSKGLPFISWIWFVDLLWAGVIGVGFYFWYSGRVWCRFACPLAALMHIYARFTQFRILADKKKCISCNVCTSVCHQGIDVMSFANKGEPMADPQCVRCSACVQSCPTGVLSFGRINQKTGDVIAEDPQWLAASPVRMTELTVEGKRI